jgi:hypothetical protein
MSSFGSADRGTVGRTADVFALLFGIIIAGSAGVATSIYVFNAYLKPVLDLYLD